MPEQESPRRSYSSAPEARRKSARRRRKGDGHPRKNTSDDRSSKGAENSEQVTTPEQRRVRRTNSGPPTKIDKFSLSGSLESLVSSNSSMRFDIDAPHNTAGAATKSEDSSTVMTERASMTDEQKAWAGIAALLNNDSCSILSAEVLPVEILAAMRRSSAVAAAIIPKDCELLDPSHHQQSIPTLCNTSISSMETDVQSVISYLKIPPGKLESETALQTFLAQLTTSVEEEHRIAEPKDDKSKSTASKASLSVSKRVEAKLACESQFRENDELNNSMPSLMSEVTSCPTKQRCTSSAENLGTYAEEGFENDDTIEYIDSDEDRPSGKLLVQRDEYNYCHGQDSLESLVEKEREAVNIKTGAITRLNSKIPLSKPREKIGRPGTKTASESLEAYPARDFSDYFKSAGETSIETTSHSTPAASSAARLSPTWLARSKLPKCFQRKSSSNRYYAARASPFLTSAFSFFRRKEPYAHRAEAQFYPELSHSEDDDGGGLLF